MKELLIKRQGAAPATGIEIRLSRTGDPLGGSEAVYVETPLADALRPLARFPPFAQVQRFVGCLLAERPQRVWIDEPCHAALELARVAAALGFETILRLPALDDIPLDEHGQRWLRGVLSMAGHWLPPAAGSAAAVCDVLGLDVRRCVDVVPAFVSQDEVAAAFGYEAYAFGRRDHALLLEMQQGFVGHFEGCDRVLDVGCGTGVFLEALARAQVPAFGVERNAMSVRYARSLGHEVVEVDALDWLEAHPGCCDGLYCSHFIEHLPIEAAERLMRATAAALRPGGLAVFVFPDPESIRSQLLGFWRDPEHVRFYHPELVQALAQVHGLTLTFDSQRREGRRVVPFDMEPPMLERARSVSPPSLWSRVLGRLGVATHVQLAAERRRADSLEAAVRTLWSVNQTWAWDDNAVLCFRKSSQGEA